MHRVAIFVDAGYLFAQGSVALSGHKLPRGSIVLDHEKAVVALIAHSFEVSGAPLLRVYWYDGTSTGPTSQHITLAHLRDVKVRLGFVNSVEEQKGVDSLIVTDLISLARNRAMTDAVLLSGDEDLRVGVQQAQEFGIRVHLLGIRPSRGSQSIFLLQECDTTHEWGSDDLKPFLACKQLEPVRNAAPTTVPTLAVNIAAPPATSVGPLEQVAIQLSYEVPEAELEALVLNIREAGQTPKLIDGRLLAKGGAAILSKLDPAQKRQIRAAFINACEARLARVEPEEGKV